MSKLHELLAVETNLENQANKTRTDLMATFNGKRHLFEEKLVTFQSLAETEQKTVEAQSTLQSTVKKELDWVSDHIERAFNASYQVAEANTLARADVILDDDAGTILLKSVPATALLELEKRLAELRQLVETIPTLDPAKGFEFDSAKNAFKAREVNKVRTKKTTKALVLYEATDKHPAQVKEVIEDTPTGKIQEQEWSGLITPAAKADMMARADQLIRAVRSARSRANDQVIDSTKKIGKQLLDYLFDGK